MATRFDASVLRILDRAMQSRCARPRGAQPQPQVPKPANRHLVVQTEAEPDPTKRRRVHEVARARSSEIVADIDADAAVFKLPEADVGTDGWKLQYDDDGRAYCTIAPM